MIKCIFDNALYGLDWYLVHFRDLTSGLMLFLLLRFLYSTFYAFASLDKCFLPVRSCVTKVVNTIFRKQKMILL